MDNFQALRSQIRTNLVLIILFENILLVGGMWLVVKYLNVSLDYVALGAFGASIVMTLFIAFAVTDYALIPLKAVWQAVVHLSPSEHGVAAPEIDKLVVGRALVANLTAQIYQIVTVAEHSESLAFKHSSSLKADFIANNLPLPLIVLDADQTILFVNNAACTYLGRSAEDITNQNVYSILNMSFPSEQTLDSWLKKAKASAVTSNNLWERVRLNITDNQPTLLFDLAAYYNKDNPQHYETLLVLFDHTSQYSQDDQAISFVALSVHELRTPLALLRGYIEAFEEETAGKLSPELEGFMSKMSATAQQLSAFVNNILNVARVDNDQLSLQLHEEKWPEIIEGAVDMMSLRAKVRGIALKLNIAKDLPTVGADRVSIQEVMANLIDNAIKYSGTSKEIVISTVLNSEGSVETTVQDFGVGVPTSVLPNLFTKFYRDHHNRAQIGGTGLGLYLSKAIVTAHGGNIWVKSKESGGTVFGFTLLPYAKLAEDTKNNDNKEIVRSAHGWIKNHSLYRR
jgi:two-component system phosphate regulon sensor histidine kinase PhoR/two-component system sensor histidine kinase VicK